MDLICGVYNMYRLSWSKIVAGVGRCCDLFAYISPVQGGRQADAAQGTWPARHAGTVGTAHLFKRAEGTPGVRGSAQLPHTIVKTSKWKLAGHAFCGNRGSPVGGLRAILVNSAIGLLDQLTQLPPADPAREASL
jgi:hypothetical protein